MPPPLNLSTLRLPFQEAPLIDLWLPFGFLGVLSLVVWLVRRYLTSLYSPTHSEHWEEASVVAPCFREDPEILRTAIGTWLAAGAREVVLVFPTDEDLNIARARAAFAHDDRVHLACSDNSEKRFMLDVGVRTASCPIVVLSDSDTLWDPDCLRNLVMAFEDPRVGGVGTRQRVLDTRSSVWRRAADWSLDAKYLTYVPAMARRGGVSCLSGRTVAYRRSVLVDVLDDLTGETFFGRRCISGDDGRLTWLVLNKGYLTTYQINAVAWTMMPDTARGFFRQRLRWARNSYRCYLRAIARGWLMRQPMITRVSVLQGLLAPFSLTIALAFVGLALARADWRSVGMWTAWIVIGRGIRAFDHLREQPRNIVLLPLMTVVVVLMLSIMKYYALLTMNTQSWITRRQDRGTAEAQDSTTLGLEPAALAAVTVLAERKAS